MLQPSEDKSLIYLLLLFSKASGRRINGVFLTLQHLKGALMTPFGVKKGGELMKTRAEIYGNEAATLLRTVTMYPGLSQQQLLCFHPGKSETAKALLSHLERQGRIFQSDNGGYFPAGYSPKADQALIKAVWVLLDFIQQADYHAPAEFPVKLVFFADGELYEVAYVAHGQEALVCHALRGNKGGSRRIIVVDSPTQIAKIDCPDISGFCTVSQDGQTQYFKKAGGT